MPTTECPPATSNATSRTPMTPLAPARKIRIVTSLPRDSGPLARCTRSRCRYLRADVFAGRVVGVVESRNLGFLGGIGGRGHAGGHRGVTLSVMRAAELRDRCLAFPGSAETFPFGTETSVFKVAGKMFALSQLARCPLQLSVKCEPLLAEELRAAHPAVLPGYHLNKRHWNTLTIDGSLTDRMINDMIEDSYDLVVGGLPLARRRALGWQADER